MLLALCLGVAAWGSWRSLRAAAQFRTRFAEGTPAAQLRARLGDMAGAAERLSQAPEGVVLLRTALDPAALPAAVFPRVVLMETVAPPSDARYYAIPSNDYPVRSAQALGARWILDVVKTDAGIATRLLPAEAVTP